MTGYIFSSRDIFFPRNIPHTFISQNVWSPRTRSEVDFAPSEVDSAWGEVVPLIHRHEFEPARCLTLHNAIPIEPRMLLNFV